ncbi:MAG: site-2 protease family protein [Clostridia bacterium]|nr:site-2 protease family protein [Clostridia bacterium]
MLPFATKYAGEPFIKEFLLSFVFISLSLTIFNLIPLATLDGGRMLFCFVCKCFSLDIALKILRLTSFFTLFVFWIFSVYLVIKISAGLPMLVFCSIFFAKCFVFDTKSRDFTSF